MDGLLCIVRMVRKANCRWALSHYYSMQAVNRNILQLKYSPIRPLPLPVGISCWLSRILLCLNLLQHHLVKKTELKHVPKHLTKSPWGAACSGSFSWTSYWQTKRFLRPNLGCPTPAWHFTEDQQAWNLHTTEAPLHVQTCANSRKWARCSEHGHYTELISVDNPVIDFHCRYMEWAVSQVSTTSSLLFISA